MAIYVRPFVTSIAHVEGCPKRNCGPSCVRQTDGWEYDIKLVLPNGDLFEERKKSPVNGKANTQRYAEERAAHAIRASVAPAVAAKKEVPTVSEFQEQFMTYSGTNNKPSTVYAKEWILEVHLVPFFGAMKLDAIGPAEIEKYKAGKLAEGLLKKSINNHLTALRKLLNLAVEWNVVDKAPKVRGFNEKREYVSEDEYLTFEEADRLLDAAAPEWRTFLVVALKTGLRVGELLALKWQDVDLVAGQAPEQANAMGGSRLLPVRVVASAPKARRATVAVPASDGLLELALPSGARLRFPAGTDLAYLRALAAAL